MSGSESPLTLKIVTPGGEAGSTECDSILLVITDNASGTGCGSLGIHKGFQNSVISLSAGPVIGKRGGEEILKAVVRSGFATVKDNVVSVITDSLESIENK